jgi:hypothetical protein
VGYEKLKDPQIKPVCEAIGSHREWVSPHHINRNQRPLLNKVLATRNSRLVPSPFPFSRRAGWRRALAAAEGAQTAGGDTDTVTTTARCAASPARRRRLRGQRWWRWKGRFTSGPTTGEAGGAAGSRSATACCPTPRFGPLARGRRTGTARSGWSAPTEPDARTSPPASSASRSVLLASARRRFPCAPATRGSRDDPAAWWRADSVSWSRPLLFARILFPAFLALTPLSECSSRVLFVSSPHRQCIYFHRSCKFFFCSSRFLNLCSWGFFVRIIGSNV